MSQAESTPTMTDKQAAAHKLTIAAAITPNPTVRREIEAQLFELLAESEDANAEALEGYYSAREYLEGLVSR